ncbi:hypothetical protein RRG08_011521 [Elysia crispata]|uniref:Uncharacterized protein n=1 Tax=Elysia crispata TaxID=231223 RepID=A0AAE1AS37_9GAST|nr:hypothetical protein RRG08_011521 [Elysia crispata]
MHLSGYNYLVFACLVVASEQWSISNETALRASLLSGYNNLVRSSETPEVYMYFQMCSIDAIDIKEQIFKTSGWWFMTFVNDSRLVWDSASNDNIQVVQMYEDAIWKPSIVVSNSIKDLSAIDEDTIPARVNYEGSVTWQPPGILSMSCEMDSTFFPFDRQTCRLVVTSFGYSLNEVSIRTDEGVIMNYYAENGDWAIKGMTHERSIYYDGGYPFSKVTFSVSVKRRSIFHWINIIIPILINSFLCCFVFLLPADSGEKMGYSLTCLLAFVVLLTLLAADMPTSAKYTSLLEIYITLSLGFSALTVFLSQLNLHIHFRDDEVHPVEGKILRLTKFAMYLVGDKHLKAASSKSTLNIFR